MSGRAVQPTSRSMASLDPAPQVFSGECPVEPRTWERPYAQPAGEGRMRLCMPARTRWYEQAVRSWMRGEYGWRAPMTDEGGGLRLEAEFAPHRPGRHRTSAAVYAPVKPDIDNFARSFLESFDFRSQSVEGERFGVIGQRTPIVAMSLSKRWADPEEWPGTRFSITRDGDEGVAFSDWLYEAGAAAGDAGLIGAHARLRPFDNLGEAPRWYAQVLDFDPVPWREPMLYGRRVGTDSHVQKWQRRARKAMMAGYGLRRPLDGPLILELEVVYGEMDERWKNQWLVLVDYAKTLMDSMDFRVRTADGHSLGVVENDSRVVALTASMRRAGEGEEPCLRFAVYPLDDSVRGGQDDVQALFDHIETGKLVW